MTTSFSRLTAALMAGCSLFPIAAFASDPASHDVSVPTMDGQTVVVEWDGTAQPGATGAGTFGDLTGIVGPSAEVGCPPAGPDDSHAINLTVPGSGYGGGTVTADFYIEWAGGATYGDPSLVAVGDPDLKLSVYKDTVTEMGWSDGGDPHEEVTLDNPEAGTYTAVVCPFSASQPTPYHGRLTLTAVAAKACIPDPGHTHSNSIYSPSSRPLDPERSGLPNFDLFAAETQTLERAVPTDAHGRYQSPIYDRALGVPTFLWARKDAPAVAVGALGERDLLIARGRAQLAAEAKALQLSQRMIDDARATDAQFNGNGPAVVRFQQRVNGHEVFHRSLNVLFSRDYRPVAVSGYFAPAGAQPAAFSLGAPQAIAAAWSALGGSVDASSFTLADTRGEWQLYSRPTLSGTHYLERAPRVKQVYYPRATGLEPAYYVELFARAKQNNQLIAYTVLVSASDARILHRENLKADAFTYRVFADNKGPLYQPYDSPLGNDLAPFRGKAHPKRAGAGSNLITLDNAGIVTNDPWLADDATTTSGNHALACKDTYDFAVPTPAGTFGSPGPVNQCVDPLEPPTSTTGDHTFDYAIAADEDPAHANAVGAAIVNLFFINNWLHDQWYNHGFDEAAGNAQVSNYGRGGEEGDPIQAQGQDGSGRNNANMSTPSDGSSPTMQQYIFDGPAIGEVHVTAPYAESLAWSPLSGVGATSYDPVTGDVALADDGFDTPTDGCGQPVPDPAGLGLTPAAAAPPQSSLQGKIALVDRGSCNFTAKEQFAMASGAIALVIVNNVDGDPPSNVGNGDIPLSPEQPTSYAYTLPTVIIRKDDGARIKAALAAGAVSMSLQRSPSVDVDGTLDNQVIAHEYFHYVHHRLTDSSNQQADAMSEGWGDTDAMWLTVRDSDANVPGNAGYGGAYALAGYVTNDFFRGIRRAPYSTSFADNAFTLKHISDGTPTPDGGDGSLNSEVHNAGEIWANEMFECYAGILNEHPFGDARSRMADYIVAGLKMTPADATYTEARDAILAAAYATDFNDYRACSHGFARRGSGPNAVAPARSSTDLTGVVEDYSDFVCTTTVGPRSEVVASGDSKGVLLGGAFGVTALMPLFGAALLARRRKRAH